jgi:hypothetical protein
MNGNPRVSGITRRAIRRLRLSSGLVALKFCCQGKTRGRPSTSSRRASGDVGLGGFPHVSSLRGRFRFSDDARTYGK